MPRAGFFVVLWAVALSTTPAWAARLLTVRIEQNGQTVLEVMATDNSENNPSLVWEVLRSAQFDARKPLVTHRGAPDRATLQGELRVAILRGRSGAGPASGTPARAGAGFLALDAGPRRSRTDAGACRHRTAPAGSVAGRRPVGGSNRASGLLCVDDRRGRPRPPPSLAGVVGLSTRPTATAEPLAC
jgi:hypothetical protein